MSEETLETAARRVVRFVRIDDELHGGLLSRDTLAAIYTLDYQVRREEVRAAAKARQAAASAEAAT